MTRKFQICYGEKYRIVNRTKKLYLDYHGNNGERLPFANTAKGTLVAFKNHNDKEAKGEIPAKAMVDLHFYYPDNRPVDKGSLFNNYMAHDTMILKLSTEYSKPVMFKPA